MPRSPFALVFVLLIGSAFPVAAQGVETGNQITQEIYYEDYFHDLAKAHHNFVFHLALSAPLPEDSWTGHLGFIHQVANSQALDRRPYFLQRCGADRWVESTE
jgi:NAD(P)H-flavin reductase